VDSAVAQEMDARGGWTVNFCWAQGVCGITSWSIAQAGPFFVFIDMAAQTGVGFTSASSFVLHYSAAGCMPNFISSKASDEYMEGSMICSPPATGLGTWTAIKYYPSAAERSLPHQGNGAVPWAPSASE
jgi:hypothetical protein